MMLTMLKAKLHRATVTGSELHYEGSITIDPALLEASGILPYEQVDVLNVNNGARFTTYAIKASKRGNGDIVSANGDGTITEYPTPAMAIARACQQLGEAVPALPANDAALKEATSLCAKNKS